MDAREREPDVEDARVAARGARGGPSCWRQARGVDDALPDAEHARRMLRCFPSRTAPSFRHERGWLGRHPPMPSRCRQEKVEHDFKERNHRIRYRRQAAFDRPTAASGISRGAVLRVLRTPRATSVLADGPPWKRSSPATRRASISGVRGRRPRDVHEHSTMIKGARPCLVRIWRGHRRNQACSACAAWQAVRAVVCEALPGCRRPRRARIRGTGQMGRGRVPLLRGNTLPA